MEGSTVLIRQVHHASGKLEMGSDWLNTALKQNKTKQKLGGRFLSLNIAEKVRRKIGDYLEMAVSLNSRKSS